MTLKELLQKYATKDQTGKEVKEKCPHGKHKNNNKNYKPSKDESNDNKN
ncbi:MAG: hypothetical protein A4E71_02822 [Smithella sp. PtaU1.Bin162]|nr:MAG: hypothetical protein A4E71_02822 [Smithella sp. PtaU1.Bin162]